MHSGVLRSAMPEGLIYQHIKPSLSALEYTVRMMQSIGKQIVVEGAETGDVVELLKEMNCDYIQGYYFSKPLPVDQFIRYIEEKKQA